MKSVTVLTTVSTSFVGMKREMHLCPGATVDAIDHATVRHEAIHAVQHCVNVARGTVVQYSCDGY